MNLIAAMMVSLASQPHPHPVTVLSVEIEGIRSFGVEPVQFVLQGSRCGRAVAEINANRTFEVEACTLLDGHVDVQWTLRDGAQYLKRRTLGVNGHGAQFDAGIEHVLAVTVKVR